MANNLKTEKKGMAIALLAEGTSIRAVERISPADCGCGVPGLPDRQAKGEETKLGHYRAIGSLVLWSRI